MSSTLELQPSTAPSGVVQGIVLDPRQPITRTPYSIQTRGIVVDAANRVGIGTTKPTSALHVEAEPTGFIPVIFGNHTGTSDLVIGVQSLIESSRGIGVYGRAFAITGVNYGVFGESRSASGRGVYGVVDTSSGTTYGVYGHSSSTSGHGVFGVAPAGTGITYGGWFESASTVGRGVFGHATGTTGVNFGVVGLSKSSSGFDFFAGGAGTNYGASSSRRWKSNIVPIGDPLDKLAQLRGVYYDWDEEHGGQHDVGMIAEEVGEVLPEIVNYEENGIDAIGMDYSKMTPLLVEAVKALQEQMNAQLRDLRIENDALRARVESLESGVEMREVAANLEGN